MQNSIIRRLWNLVGPHTTMRGELTPTLVNKLKERYPYSVVKDGDAYTLEAPYRRDNGDFIEDRVLSIYKEDKALITVLRDRVIKRISGFTTVETFWPVSYLTKVDAPQLHIENVQGRVVEGIESCWVPNREFPTQLLISNCSSESLEPLNNLRFAINDISIYNSQINILGCKNLRCSELMRLTRVRGLLGLGGCPRVNTLWISACPDLVDILGAKGRVARIRIDACPKVPNEQIVELANAGVKILR